MIDAKATIAAMRAAGIPAETILIALECYQEVNQPAPAVSGGTSPVDARLEKIRAYDRDRKRRKKGEVGKSDGDVPAETVELPTSSASPLVPPLSPAPLSPPIIPPPPPPPPDGEPAKPEVEKPSRKGTRLPPEFVPDATCEAAARELKFTKADWKRWFEEFRDYWTGVPGAKGVKLDWQATARNSIRRYAERRPYGKSTHQTDMAAAFDNLERKIGEHSGPSDGAGGPEPPDDSGLSY